MKFHQKNLLALLVMMVYFSLSPIHTAGAQQITESQRQVLIAQIQQLIMKFQQQLLQIPGHQARPEIPVRLVIPKIHVDVIIDSVGLTQSGGIDVPQSPMHAGWLKLEPRPGQEGNAIIDGHFGWWKDGTPGIFNELSLLQMGDKIYTQDQAGAIITFVVQKIRIYDKSVSVGDALGLADGAMHLDIITCQGAWNNAEKTYSSRLIVFADKE